MRRFDYGGNSRVYVWERRVFIVESDDPTAARRRGLTATPPLLPDAVPAELVRLVGAVVSQVWPECESCLMATATATLPCKHTVCDGCFCRQAGLANDPRATLLYVDCVTCRTRYPPPSTDGNGRIHHTAPADGSAAAERWRALRARFGRGDDCTGGGNRAAGAGPPPPPAVPVRAQQQDLTDGDDWYFDAADAIAVFFTPGFLPPRKTAARRTTHMTSTDGGWTPRCEPVATITSGTSPTLRTL